MKSISVRSRLLVYFALLIISVLSTLPTARAEFVGELELIPSGCEANGLCRLGQDFGFKDAGGVGWQAAKGLLTDGASIPNWAQPIIGQPFTKEYLKAAVIHDHYCVRRVRPWRQTHRVFYDALVKSGVPSNTAGVMYFAVLIGGPKWAKVIAGKPCPIGLNCVNSVGDATQVRSGVGLNEERFTLITRGPEYGTANFANVMDANARVLRAKGDALTPAEVEAQADAAMQDDFYFKNPEEVGGQLDLTPE